MDVYIKSKDGTFHFPVNPFSISVNGGKVYETFDILYKGEIDFPAAKAKKIKTLTLNTMFPFEYEPYCQYENIPTPVAAMNKIVKWTESDEVVRLIITEYGFNELVNLVDYQDDQSGESQKDKYIALDFRIKAAESIDIVTVEKPKKKSPAPKLKPRAKPKKEKVYVVKKGDSLWKISKRLYGNGAQYKKIYNANKKIVGKNPNLIYPGQKFIIPG